MDYNVKTAAARDANRFLQRTLGYQLEFQLRRILMKKILALCALLASCSPNQNPAAGTIAPEKFEAIYIELLDSAAIAAPSATDSALSPTAERILQRHEVTIAQFKATVARYNTDTRKWQEFYENVVKKYHERSRRPAE